MLTRAATRSLPDSLDNPYETVLTGAELVRLGWPPHVTAAQLRARRWQRFGRAIVLHNGPLHPDERPRVALANCGPRARLTAFTAAEMCGLRNWERDEISVLVPGGARVVRSHGVPMRVHYVGSWQPASRRNARDLEALAPALVRASSTLAAPRSAAAILAAAVQQRLITANQLRAAVVNAPRTRHRATLLHALADIAQGSEALSEIDFVALYRRYHLPLPMRQTVRTAPGGRRRYLDAEWTRRDGRRVVVEVDGALHLMPQTWWSDQLRQNELVIGGDIVLRFPSIVLRCDQATVAAQLASVLLV